VLLLGDRRVNFGGWGTDDVGTQDFELAKQVFYWLIHIPVHFALVILKWGSQDLFVIASFTLPPNLSLTNS
jgi:hypothetical protein